MKFASTPPPPGETQPDVASAAPSRAAHSILIPIFIVFPDCSWRLPLSVRQNAAANESKLFVVIENIPRICV